MRGHGYGEVGAAEGNPVAENEDGQPIARATTRWLRGKEHWLAAMRWRREVEGALAPLGLTFTRWLVLEATRDQIVEAGDAVSQSTVAARCELDRTTVSQAMTALETKGLVDRGPDLSTRAYRVVVTKQGHKVAEQAERLVAHILPPVSESERERAVGPSPR